MVTTDHFVDVMAGAEKNGAVVKALIVHPAVIPQVEKWYWQHNGGGMDVFERHEQKYVTRIAGIDVYARLSWCGIPIIESTEIRETIIIPFTQEDERVMQKYDMLLGGIIERNVRRQVREQVSRMVR